MTVEKDVRLANCSGSGCGLLRKVSVRLGRVRHRREVVYPPVKSTVLGVGNCTHLKWSWSAGD